MSDSSRRFMAASREIVLDKVRVIWLTVLCILVGLGIFFAGVRYGKNVEKIHTAVLQQERFFVAEDILPPMEVPVPIVKEQAQVAPTVVHEEKPALADVSPPKAPQHFAEEQDAYAIQVAAVHDRKQADKAVRDLKAKGISAYLGPTHYGSSGKWYRVWIGNYSQKDAAIKAMATLSKSIKRSAFIVSLNQNQGGSERGHQAVSQARR